MAEQRVTQGLIKIAQAPAAEQRVTQGLIEIGQAPAAEQRVTQVLLMVAIRPEEIEPCMTCNYRLFDASLDLARILMDVHEGWATSDSANALTLVDTRLGEPDDWYTGGTLWALSAQESRYVSDHTLSSHTLQFDALTATPTASTLYAVAPAKFPKYLLWQAINAAIREIGPVKGETTLTSDGSEEYVAADNAAIDQKILSVEVAGGKSEPYGWQPHRNWRQIPTGADGTAAKLIFDEGTEPGAGYLIRLIYLVDSALLDGDADCVPNDIHPDLVIWTAAVHAWRWRMGKVKTDEPEAAARMEEAQGMTALMRSRHWIERKKDTRVARW